MQYFAARVEASRECAIVCFLFFFFIFFEKAESIFFARSFLSLSLFLSKSYVRHPLQLDHFTRVRVSPFLSLARDISISWMRHRDRLRIKTVIYARTYKRTLRARIFRLAASQSAERSKADHTRLCVRAYTNVYERGLNNVSVKIIFIVRGGVRRR